MTTPSLDLDLSCVGCRYNLRGLPVHGLCPECGLALDISRAEHDRRLLIDPASGMLRRGLFLLLVTPFVFWVCCCVLSSVSRGHSKFWPALLILLPVTVCWGAGLWLITAPDLRLSGVESCLRKIARCCSVVPAVLAVVCCFVGGRLFLASMILLLGIWALPFFYLRILSRAITGKSSWFPSVVVGTGLILGMFACWTDLISRATVRPYETALAISLALLLMFSIMQLAIFLILFNRRDISAAVKREAGRRAALQRA